ncbi:MAG: cytochrome b/b6 domain-containing protein [Acidobacteria bacterium]|nr:cytochrome b/b6 domain-containing protein [Acidobacteriota bacterium]
MAPTNVSAQVCASCHTSVALNQKYGLPPGRFQSFADSYHGLASRAGSAEVANCASCHGVHNIKPSSDPTSTIHKANLVATCGKCHPGAGENFTKGTVHVLMESKDEGILYWVRRIYIWLIVTIVGGMFLHNLFDFVKKSRIELAIRKGRIPAPHRPTGEYPRMSLNERTQHWLLMTSFIVLVVTGFMLRFPDAWWVLLIRGLSEHAFELRGLLHRIAGVIMIGAGLYHAGYVAISRRGRRVLLDLLPSVQDVRDAWRLTRYNLGLSAAKPQFHRFGYPEKAEYWALVWGIVVMAGTGFILWFNNFFLNLLTKQGWDIARAIHYYEAILATLSILVWHFYFVIFNPSVYPINPAWWAGTISAGQMEEEHPLELAELLAAEAEKDAEA